MGGAETMLYKLLKYVNNEKYDVSIISMMDEGVYGEKIRDLGFKVICLNMKQGIPTINSFIKARKHTKNTDIIQTWMYHADLFGYLLFKFSSAKKLIWGIRRSNLDPNLNKKSTIAIAKINSKLSKKVDAIVSCSIKAKEVHSEFGYYDRNMIVIPNGFELTEFSKDLQGKLKLSMIVGRGEDIPYILHVGRWNNLKDHKNLLSALYKLKNKGIKFHAVLVGPNIDEENKDLANLLNDFSLNNNVSLLGRRNDITTLMSGADIFVSSSIDEGFPNVIGEAMACETPCVATDAGDSAYIVGNTGKIVPTRNSTALATSILEMLDLPKFERNKLGLLARQRVNDQFDIHKVTSQFEELYKI